ncbi:MAG: ABC transporter substrate-binding protein [Methylobacterium sp.]|nr:ABC transporter substrate-binding protein [Methylobacterium sp.]MCA3652001.1 ABC transporter substrate-binding protein [Methylobacterium sp.]MCA4921771.1 ABC transporter substrate-binding protein [Methylobacterium sp.]
MQHSSCRLALSLGLAALALPLALPATAQAPRDSVVVCQTLEPPILDPAGGAAAAIREVTYDNVFETLLAFNAEGRIEPRLAEKIESSADGLIHTITLRSGVTFHDGAALTAEDVKFSFERAMAPDSKNSQKWIFAPIDRIEARDTRTVIITLKSYVGDFLDGLAWADATIFSAKSADKAATEPVGTGPYQLVRWNRGDRLVLKRNENYWGRKPAIANATFRFISDPQAQVAALTAGDCDAHTNLSAPEAVPQLRANANLRVSIGRTEGETIVAMNNGKAPFNNPKVREAISKAIDRAQVNEGAISGFGTLIGTHFSPNHPAYVDLTGAVKYDPAAAKRLLAEAGYPNGFSVTLRLPPPAYAQRGGEIVAAMLGQVGIKVSIEPVQWAQWLERVFRQRDYDLTIIAHVEPLDINIYARDGYYFGYVSEAVKAAVARTKSAKTEAERIAAYQEAQRLITADHVNVYLFMLPKITVSRAGLKGMWNNWPVPANPLAQLSWE